MISVITVVHNQRAMNQLFLSHLSQFTFHPYELVVIDNASTDGSGAMFEAAGAKVLRNEQNLAYPITQNQGAALATGDYLVFMNNDVLVGPHWDKHLLQIMQQKGVDIISPASIDRAESRSATFYWRRRWKMVRYLSWVMGNHAWSFRLRQRFMYGNWEDFCNRRLQQFGDGLVEGFAGHTLFMHRSVYAKLGSWDEQILQADFDLYMRSRERWETVGDVKPIAVATGIFVHHYGRLTMRRYPKAWVPIKPIIEIEEKWGEQAFLEKTAHLDLHRPFNN